MRNPDSFMLSWTGTSYFGVVGITDSKADSKKVQNGFMIFRNQIDETWPSISLRCFVYALKAALTPNSLSGSSVQQSFWNLTFVSVPTSNDLDWECPKSVAQLPCHKRFLTSRHSGEPSAGKDSHVQHLLLGPIHEIQR